MDDAGASRPPEFRRRSCGIFRAFSNKCVLSGRAAASKTSPSDFRGFSCVFSCASKCRKERLRQMRGKERSPMKNRARRPQSPSGIQKRKKERSCFAANPLPQTLSLGRLSPMEALRSRGGRRRLQEAPPRSVPGRRSSGRRGKEGARGAGFPQASVPE